MYHTDVVVVGGGPAGSCAGAAAAATGADTVVLEQGVPRAERDAPGPDSTDAAAFLDYWVDLAGLDYADIPASLITQPIEAVTFYGPSERVSLHESGRPSSCPTFAFTFDRVGFDDWLRSRAEAAGAAYHVGVGVRTVESRTSAGGPRHVITLQDGTEFRAEALVLADGPQRRVTIPTVEQFLPDGRRLRELDPVAANHVGYQEYRRFPRELFDADELGFWWGWMPGETAYCWIFPDEEPVARVGFTRPLVDAGRCGGDYRLLAPDEDHMPGGRETIRRFLSAHFGDCSDVDTAFPVDTTRGKRAGTETYPISSTRPIESPTGANVAVTGGAMGATSAFHEGGYYLAMRTGTIAGRLAGRGRLDAYNAAWRTAVGSDIRLNVAVADMVAGYGPADWDHAFRVAREMGYEHHAFRYHKLPTPAGKASLGFFAGFGRRLWRFRGKRFVGLREDAYEYG